MFQSLIGDKTFYKRFFTVAIPIIIQNGITNFVNLLDNVMVGQVGTLPMSGVSIVNGLLMVFNLCVFGASSGAGIFTAQFHGSADQTGIRHTFRFKLLICTLIVALGSGIFLLGDELLIGLYLTGEGNADHAGIILDHGIRYLRVMMWGFLPFAVSNAYSSTLRETGQTFVPMIAGISAVLVNLVLNYVLIFGHFGAPALGIEGAAVATVISRFVELAIVSIWTHTHSLKNPFIRGAYQSLYIPGKLFRSIVAKGMPLLINEFLWASGMAILSQCYSTCGLDVVPAMNISNTLYNLGSVVFLSMGISVGIMMGQMLGAGHEAEEIRDANRKLIATGVTCALIFAVLVGSMSALFPRLYNTTDEVRHLATTLICINALLMPFNAYTNATYFTLRSGGQALVTFLFDSCFVWVFCVPTAYLLSRFTDMGIVPLFAICHALELLKCAIGTYMLKKGKWIQNLTT